MEGATSFVTHYIYWQKSELKQHDMSPSSTHSFNFDRWSADVNFRNIAVICQNAGFFISRTLWFTAARLLVVSLKTRNLQARNSFLLLTTRRCRENDRERPQRRLFRFVFCSSRWGLFAAGFSRRTSWISLIFIASMLTHTKPVIRSCTESAAYMYVLLHFVFGTCP